MGQRVLFNTQDIFNFVEIQQGKLEEAYGRLSDDEALDRERLEQLKESFLLRVPILRSDPDQWTAEERDTEVIVYVPFEGDPAVFDILPSAENGTIASGEIVGQELILRVNSAEGYDIMAHVRRELANVTWRLHNLRGSNEHLKEQLDTTAARCMAAKRRSLENKAQVSRDLGIPRRQPMEKPVVVIGPEQSLTMSPKSSAPATPALEKWDVFMSHASPDKPYVKPLVAALVKADVKVWYDEHSLGWGDQLRPGINRGLVNSRYAIVVLSKAFLALRKWTDHELNGLFAREKAGDVTILPIWHGIGHDDLLVYDPALADRLAKISDTDSHADIVASILKILERGTPDTIRKGVSRSYPAVDQEKESRELMAYAWYEQKGPGAQSTKVFVRKSSSSPRGYVLVDGNQEHEGTEEEISSDFFAVHRRLVSQGYHRMQFSNRSNKPAFNI